MKVQWHLKRAADGWAGIIDIPLPLAPVRVMTKGRNKQEAIARAAVAAKAIATNPLLQAVMPPGTGAAVMAITALAQSPTAQTLTKFAGPGAKRLVKALGKIF